MPRLCAQTRVSSSTVGGSTSLLMTRTRSAVRCRGIYRPRDTRVLGRERDSGGRRHWRAKRGLVLSSESFPRGGASRNDGGRVKEEGAVAEFFAGRPIRPRVCGRFLSAGEKSGGDAEKRRTPLPRSVCPRGRFFLFVLGASKTSSSAAWRSSRGSQSVY